MKRGVVASGLVAVAIIAACADLSGLTGGSGDGGVDAGIDGALGEPDAAPPAVDGGPADAAAADADQVDANAIDAAGCGTCDCDKDGFNREEVNCPTEAGIDCDDTVAAIHPNAGFLLNGNWPSSHQPAFDWNCDGTVTKQLATNTVCSGVAPSCSGEGFQSDPECGEDGKYVKCTASGVACSPTALGPQKQSCR